MQGREGWRKIVASLAGFPVSVLLMVFLLGTIGKLNAVSIVITLAWLLGMCPLKAMLSPKRGFFDHESTRGL